MNNQPLLSSLLAKTYEDASPMNILTHSLISGMVAKHLIDRFNYNLVGTFPVFEQSMALIAALHDVGKINECFQKKIQNKERSSVLNPSSWGWHAGVSELFLQNLLVKDASRFEYKKQIKKYIPPIVGRHHGTNPPLHRYRIEDSVFGGEEWQTPRIQLYEFLVNIFGDTWTKIENESIEWVVSGLVSVSDWIASSMQYKNLCVDSSAQDIASLDETVQHTLDTIGFRSIDVVPHLSFTDIFSFEPNALQEQAIKHIQSPGVYIIEAEMGQGKTEVGLYAAYQLMQHKKARGIYFGLPTRLTSQKIFQRFQKFIDKILAPDDSSQSPYLIHSTSQWNNFGIYELTEINEEGKEEQRWFLSKKRALIAPFGVGTIDQALFATLNTKFWFIRTCALAGKVVILDEVHSYDAYTGTIFDRLIHHLVKIGCTVIILSATLSKSRINTLVSQIPQEEKSNQSEPDTFSYPCIHCIQESTRTHIPIPSHVQHTVTIEHRHTSQNEQVLDDTLTLAIAKAEQGELVLWIENSVAEAQNVYRVLSARTQELAIETGLLHSRFLPKDREELESIWIDKYGKKDVPERPSQGSILVGTQVLEQSLDIDADLLITRLAPTDMLLQRIGRLWRHEKHDPLRPKGATRRCIIISPEEHAIKEKVQYAFGTSGVIYAPYVLARSFDVWKHITEIHLPTDIRALIENTYTDMPHEDTQLQKAKQELDTHKDKLSRQADNSISHSSSLMSEHKVSTRFSETETIDVLCITRMQVKDDNTIVLVFTDGTEVKLLKDKSSSLHEDKKKIALALMHNTISVYTSYAPDTIIQSQGTLRAYISKYIYTGKKGEPCLVVVCVDASERLVWEGNEILNNKYSLYYSHRKGFYTEKRSS